MTDLTSYRVTDGIDDVLAAQYNRVLDSAVRGELSNIQSLTSNKTLTDADFALQVYNPTAARDVTLPAVASGNHPFYIINSSASYALTVKNAGGATIGTVAVSSSGSFASDGTAWHSFGGGGGVAPDITLALTHAATSKTPPIDTDELPLLDSAASYGLKKLTWANIKSALTSVFAPYVAPGTVRKLLVSDGSAWTSAALTAAQLADAVAPSTSGNVLTSNGSTWTSAAASGGGTVTMFKNRLINGAMNIDQRNAGAAQTITAAAALAYTVDRWYAYCTGANVTGQQVAGSTPNAYNYRFTGASSVTKIGFAQRIEAINGQDLAGTTCTLSVDLANSLLTTVTWVAYYANTTDTFGTLASPTRTQIATGTITVTSTLTRYSVNIAIPAAATTGIEIELSVAAQTSGTWTIGRAQLESGASATGYDYRPYSIELALCQRYCMSWRATEATTYGFVGQCLSTTNVIVPLIFPVTARAKPTGILASAASTLQAINAIGAPTVLSSIAYNQSSTFAVLVYGTVGSSVYVAGNATAIGFATAGYIYTTGSEL